MPKGSKKATRAARCDGDEEEAEPLADLEAGRAKPTVSGGKAKKRKKASSSTQQSRRRKKTSFSLLHIAAAAASLMLTATLIAVVLAPDGDLSAYWRG